MTIVNLDQATDLATDCPNRQYSIMSKSLTSYVKCTML